MHYENLICTLKHCSTTFMSNNTHYGALQLVTASIVSQESHECPHCVISFPYASQFLLFFLSAGFLRIQLRAVLCYNKLELTGGTWLLFSNIISSRICCPGRNCYNQGGDRELISSTAFSLLKVNMSFIVARQVFIRLIATLQKFF